VKTSAVILTLLCVVLLAAPSALGDVKTDSLTFGRFGTVHLYQGSATPSRVVLFVSGDGGWNLGVVDMARSLATLDAVVAGVDIIHYLHQLDSGTDSCSYPAADFEALSQYLQKKLELPNYIIPILVGYSSGATLVYATLVEAPPNTFKGALSLGFCPDLPLTKPLCRGNGLEWGPGPKGKGYSFLPSPQLQMPWIALQGMIDQVCDPATVTDFVRHTRSALMDSLPKVGHGFSVPKNWMPQFTKSFKHLEEHSQIDTVSHVIELHDLPLVEVPASGPEGDMMAVMISGDGGWASVDRQLSKQLADHGIPAVGLNALKYFWTRRTPDEASGDLERIIQYYMPRWKKKQVLLIGYSRGADVLPFMANRLPDSLLSNVQLICLIGAERSVDFQFHLSDFLGSPTHPSDLPTKPEVDKLRGRKVLCIRGDEENASLCEDLDTAAVDIVVMKGGHHMGGSYSAMADIIMHEVGWQQ
jgi:type IV secretory pathway VirJ component